jgi:hypothetical protein
MEAPLSGRLPSFAAARRAAGAASAAIPIGPAGAATQVTAGATLLIVSGVEAGQALGFALAAQALLIFSGAAIFLAAVAWRTSVHAWSFRPGRRVRIAHT